MVERREEEAYDEEEEGWANKAVGLADNTKKAGN